MANPPNDTITPDAEARFWVKVDRRGPDECWPWIAHVNEHGYGRFMLNGKSCGAHRVALLLSGGGGFGGAFALHSCDNPPCCNPAHLRWGTHRENMDEMILRGRSVRCSPKGSAHAKAKLDEAAVRIIKRDARNNQQIANDFGVSRECVRDIKNGLKWRHVHD